MKPFIGKAIYQPTGKAGCHGRVKSNGYYAVYIPEHPYAFGRGYVYEHRLVVEKQIGRHLMPSEIVHHKDGNKRNNHPDNLELFSSIAEHKSEHRTNHSKIKRLPGEHNVTVECACGCGEKLPKYDKYGREKKYFNSGCAARHRRITRQNRQAEEMVLCACGCGTEMRKYDQYGRVRKFISGHNHTEIPNKTELAKDAGLSFATIINYFNGKKLRATTIETIEQIIIAQYGKDYLRK